MWKDKDKDTDKDKLLLSRSGPSLEDGEIVGPEMRFVSRSLIPRTEV